MRHFALLLVLTSIIGCGDDRAAVGPSYPAPPSSALLCGLVRHESTVVDVRRVLGAPGNEQTFADGTATSLYYYDQPNATPAPVALIQFWFTSDARFESATVANIQVPPCWATDGGI